MLTRGWLVSAGLLFTTLAAAADRPNILICMADDWGWPHAGAYGDAVVQTPTFDALARDGVLFSHAYVSSPSCTPSRNATLTGQQFYRLDQGANLHSSLDPRHPNFLLLVRDAGYQVGHWRKAWGPGEPRALGYRESPVGKRQSFDQFLAQRDPSKPFCFWFGTTDPHRGYEAGNGAKSGMDLAAIHVPDFYPDAAEIRSDMADYYWEVQRWDREVGAAIDLVKQAGELENTIIVMTGDHGMPFPRCKGNLYDWGTRVPLAVRWTAEVAPGRQLDNFVSLTDLAPTFLQAAGVAVPANMTGHSLLPLLTAPGSARPDVDDRVVDRSFVVFGRERHVPAQRMPSLAGYPCAGDSHRPLAAGAQRRARSLAGRSASWRNAPHRPICRLRRWPHQSVPDRAPRRSGCRQTLPAVLCQATGDGTLRLPERSRPNPQSGQRPPTGTNGRPPTAATPRLPTRDGRPSLYRRCRRIRRLPLPGGVPPRLSQAARALSGDFAVALTAAPSTARLQGATKVVQRHLA